MPRPGLISAPIGDSCGPEVAWNRGVAPKDEERADSISPAPTRPWTGCGPGYRPHLERSLAFLEEAGPERDVLRDPGSAEALRS